MDLSDFEKRFILRFRECVEHSGRFEFGRTDDGVAVIRQAAPCQEFGFLAIMLPEPDTISVGCAVTQKHFHAWRYERHGPEPQAYMIEDVIKLVADLLGGRARAKIIYKPDGTPALSGFYGADETPMNDPILGKVFEKYFGGESAITEFAWAGLTKH